MADPWNGSWDDAWDESWGVGSIPPPPVEGCSWGDSWGDSWAQTWCGHAPVVDTSAGTGNVRRWDHIKQIFREEEELLAILTS